MMTKYRVSGSVAGSLVGGMWRWLNRRISPITLVLVLVSLSACGGTRNLSHLFDTDAEPPPDSQLAYTVYLVGDAGEPFLPDGSAKPALQLLDAELGRADSNSAVIFLGDNIYPSGLPHTSAPNREQAEAKLMAQLDIVADFPGEVIFIPGNHDWGGNGLGGELQALNRQEDFIEERLDRGNVFLPDGGFPGPSIVEFSDSLVVIAIDTQWWLEPNKLYGDTGLYQLELESEFLLELDDVLKRYDGWCKLVVGHHPLFSNGEHGGYFSSRDDLYILAPLSRRYLGTPQDISNRKYRVLREGLLAVFKQHPNLIYASGHDHNLQYFVQGEQHYIVSGSASKQGHVAHNKGEVFADDAGGFATLRYYRDGSIWLTFLAPEGDTGEADVLWSAAIVKAKEDGNVQSVAAGHVSDQELGTPVESVTESSTSEVTEGSTDPEDGVRSEGETESQGTEQDGTVRHSNGSHGSGTIEGDVEPSVPAETGADAPGDDYEALGDGGSEEQDDEEGGEGDSGGNEDEELTPYATRAKGISAQTPYQFCAERWVTTSASERYDVGKFREMILGKGYRDVWKVPIQVPVIDLECTAGGLTPIQRGGGLQTISLRLQGKDGKQYVLRSIDKDPRRTIPEYLQETVAHDIIQDQISATNPYAAIVIPRLARAANVLHTYPTVTSIPDSPVLGMYREEFAGMLTFMEDRPDEDQSDKARYGFSTNVIGTPRLFEKLREDNDDTVAIRAWIRARLLDMLIGDWDRHKDQWRWAEFQGEYGTMFEPVARDRDFAFFKFSGPPRLFARLMGDPQMRRFSNFGPKYGDVLGLNFNGAAMDRRLTGPVGREVWVEIADSLRAVVTDEVIEEAIRQWPDPVFEEVGVYTIESLKARRDKLPEVANQYYDLLAHVVDFVGTDKHERFEIRQIDGDQTEVIVYKTKKEGDIDRELYRRTLLKGETGEIRIYGFGGNDTFVVSGQRANGIDIRIIGGEGDDRFVDAVVEGADNVIFYDNKTGTTIEETHRDAHLRLDDDPRINIYNDERFEYSIISPVASIGYNGTSGLFLGGGVKLIVPEFRKYPYGQRHVLEANFAVRERAYNVLYTGESVDMYGAWDADLRARVLAVNNLRSYYGLGNETDDDARDFFRARVQYLRLEPTLRKGVAPFTSLLAPFTTVGLGPRFEYANVEPPEGISENAPDPNRTHFTAEDFKDAYYLGAYTSLVINGLDTLVATESGVRWANEVSVTGAVRGTNDLFVRLTTDLRYFYTFTFQPRTTLAFRVGAAHNIGDFAFYHANTLGETSNLRGYPTTRFWGRTSFFQNIEARTKLFDFNAYLARGEFGVLAFFDNGRVWWDDEHSKRWHQGFGGGVWAIPFYRVALVSTLGFSPEEGRHLDFSLGFLF